MFFDGTYRGEKIRVAALRAPNGFVVQVGETLHKRNRLVGEILLAELVPTLLIARGVDRARMVRRRARACVPLEHLRAELLEPRRRATCGRLPETASPVEIAPVVDAFNDLLGHLRDANTMQQRFLANAAHQLRTPLAGLQMHLELLLRRELAAGRARRSSSACTARPMRASRLANQLLALAKAESAPDHGQRARDRRPAWRSPATPRATGRRWRIAQKIDLGFALERARRFGAIRCCFPSCSTT